MGICFQPEPIMSGGHQPGSIGARAATDIHHRRPFRQIFPEQIGNLDARLLDRRTGTVNIFPMQQASRSPERRLRRKGRSRNKAGTSRTVCSASVLEVPSSHDATMRNVASRGSRRGGRILPSILKPVSTSREDPVSRNIRAVEKNSCFGAAAVVQIGANTAGRRIAILARKPSRKEKSPRHKCSGRARAIPGLPEAQKTQRTISHFDPT